MRRHHTRHERVRAFAVALLLGTLAGLAGCGASTAGAGSGATSTSGNTPGQQSTSAAATTPTATASAATPALPTPTNVPAGWQVFTGHYYTIAYPAGWTAAVTVQSTTGRPAGSWAASDSFTSPDRASSFSVLEEDQVTQADIQQNCAASDTATRLVAGLPMLYRQPSGTARYDYSFLTPQGVTYDLQYTAAPGGTQDSAQYMQAFGTFRPVSTASACPAR